MPKSNTEKPTFTLVAPHYHNGWSYKFVAEELRMMGYDSLKVTLPISDSLTLDEHAELLRQQEREKGADSYINVGASWGGDLIYRQLGGIPLAGMVFLAAPLRPIFRRNGLNKVSPKFENNPSVRYQAVVRGYENNQSPFPRQDLSDIFYADFDPFLKDWASKRLQPHPHVEENDTNAILPSGVDMYYVGMLDDAVFPYERQPDTANALGMQYVPLPSGHISILEQPKLTAEVLVQIAENKVDWAKWGELERQNRLKKLSRFSMNTA